MASIPELLKSALSEAEYALLERLTRGWKDNPFHFDRDSGQFELADDWLFRYGEAMEEDYEERDDHEKRDDYEGHDDYGKKSEVSDEEVPNPGGKAPEPGDLVSGSGTDGGAVLDLLLRSCELLTSKVAELDRESLGRGAGGSQQGKAEEVTLSFTFNGGIQGAARNDLAVADKFVDLVSQDPVYRLSVVDGQNTKLVEVSFNFRSDHEFFTRKNQIQWFLEAARRISADSPFGGTKL